MTDARSAITDLQYRYALAVDNRDVDGIVSCFTQDAVVEFNDGEVLTRGAHQLRSFFRDAFEGVLLGAEGASTHLMGNVLVSLEHEVAKSDTQAVAYLASEARAEVLVRGLRYRDTCVRGDDGRWRIRQRTHSAIWQAAMPRVPISPALHGTERRAPRFGVTSGGSDEPNSRSGEL